MYTARVFHTFVELKKMGQPTVMIMVRSPFSQCCQLLLTKFCLCVNTAHPTPLQTSFYFYRRHQSVDQHRKGKSPLTQTIRTIHSSRASEVLFLELVFSFVKKHTDQSFLVIETAQKISKQHKLGEHSTTHVFEKRIEFGRCRASLYKINKNQKKRGESNN